VAAAIPPAEAKAKASAADAASAKRELQALVQERDRLVHRQVEDMHELTDGGQGSREETAATEPASLMKQLGQLEMRARADMERERWCTAVDRAVAELVSIRNKVASRVAV
jgi:hypothetical protein